MTHTLAATSPPKDVVTILQALYELRFRSLAIRAFEPTVIGDNCVAGNMGPAFLPTVPTVVPGWREVYNVGSTLDSEWIPALLLEAWLRPMRSVELALLPFGKDDTWHLADSFDEGCREHKRRVNQREFANYLAELEFAGWVTLTRLTTWTFADYFTIVRPDGFGVIVEHCGHTNPSRPFWHFGTCEPGELVVGVGCFDAELLIRDPTVVGRQASPVLFVQPSERGAECLRAACGGGVEFKPEMLNDKTSAGDGADPASRTAVVPNPSKPMSLKEAAQCAGFGSPEKLRGLMDAGRVRYKKLNRQTFVFSCDDLPNLPQK